MRRTQPADYEALHAETKLMALDYEARQREARLLDGAKKETRTDADSTARRA
jgi:hypothetical protein